MCKLNLVPSRQKAVENGRNLTLEDELSVDESDLFFSHLCLSSSPPSLLSTRRCRTVLIIVLIPVILLRKRRLRMKRAI